MITDLREYLAKYYLKSIVLSILFLFWLYTSTSIDNALNYILFIVCVKIYYNGWNSILQNEIKVVR